MTDQAVLERARDHFAKILIPQLERVERIKHEGNWVDYSKVKPIIVGTIGGDGIGPAITEVAEQVLKELLADRGVLLADDCTEALARVTLLEQPDVIE